MRATQAHQQRYSLITYDARNASNTMKHCTILPALADLIPPAVLYAINVYARKPPKTLFKTATGETGIVHSSRGIQQRWNLGPLCYSASLL